MAWITSEEIEAVYPSADLTSAQIAHLQGLAEGCTGPQEEPVSARLKAALIEVAYRFWRGQQAAAVSPEGYQAERTPEYGYEHPAGGPVMSGFGLTDRECKALRTAAGVSSMWVQRVSRGEVETPSGPDAWSEPDFDVV